MQSKFGYIPVATFMGKSQVDHLMAAYLSALRNLGGQRWDKEQLPNAAPLCFLVVTGGTEEQILTLRAERAQSTPDEPVFLIAHPGNNSLPASLEVLARLQQDGAPGRIFYLRGPEDSAGLQQLAGAIHDLAIRRVLRETRLGLLGVPSDWLVASSPTAATVRASWGPEVVPVSMREVTETFQAVADEELGSWRAQLVQNASEVLEPSASELNDVVRVYVALRKLVQQYQLDALTLRCFDLVLGQQTTGCFALSQLSDEGVIASCEGDMVSLIGKLWAYLLLGELPWMGNPAQIDAAGNALWLAHCTVPRRMVESYRLRSHFESGLGVGLQGELPTGPVTLLRIGGKQLEQLWLAEGELTQTGRAENLCRTQAQIQLTRGAVTDLLRKPLGNHLVLVRGHHADHLRRSWQAIIG
ncbi:MAG TPA: hypothetical protein G4N98_02420 [Thermoflexia bacterium]|nr:hypothetical protein [Thermoflexia bacterium]